MNILFLGDVVGRVGRTAVAAMLGSLVREHSIDFVIANGENAAGGYGLTPETALELLEAGVDCLTSGNHIWKHREVYDFLGQQTSVLRPANYPPGAPGRGAAVYAAADGTNVAVINLLGRIFMGAVDCPFRCGEQDIQQIAGEADVIVVDFHAEATSEKRALGFFLDGRVTAVIGTHTHVQTSDEQILAGGSAYITDCGMTGPVDTVIGAEKEVIIERFTTGLPQRFVVPKSGSCLISGVVIQCKPENGLAEGITRINVPYPAAPK